MGILSQGGEYTSIKNQNKNRFPKNSKKISIRFMYHYSYVNVNVNVEEAKKTLQYYGIIQNCSKYSPPGIIGIYV